MNTLSRLVSCVSSPPMRPLALRPRARRALAARPTVGAAPAARAAGDDLGVGAGAEHRVRMVLGVPTGDGVVVVLVDQQPLVGVLACLLRCARSRTGRGACDRAARTSARRRRSRRPDRRSPGTRDPAPTNRRPTAIDVALAVAAADVALEPAVRVRVVLDLDRQVAPLRVEARPLRHCPADEHAVDLEAQVVVQPRGSVPLHDEAPAPVRRVLTIGGGSGVAEKSRLASYSASLLPWSAICRRLWLGLCLWLRLWLWLWPTTMTSSAVSSAVWRPPRHRARSVSAISSALLSMHSASATRNRSSPTSIDSSRRSTSPSV